MTKGTYPDFVYAVSDGIMFASQLVKRQRGLTFVCGKCNQGVAWREGKRDISRCKVCGSKFRYEYLPDYDEVAK